MAATDQGLVEAVPPDLLVDVVGDVPGGLVDLTHDSRQVDSGWVFACVPGEQFDGHDFAGGAVEAGAALLLVERPLPLAVPQIVVADVRRAMGPVAAQIHGHPARALTMIGVTGTNGKTTTTHLIGAVLRAAGRTERQLGTLSGARTTPEAPDLQRRLAGFVREGVDAVVMEVSSHALELHRVAGTRFDVAVFTNLGRDHLDLHGTMEAYFRAKASLFTPGLSDRGVTNLDDTYGRLLLDVAEIDMEGYALADVGDLEVGVAHHSFTWHGRRVTVPLGGDFNVSNSLAALHVAAALGIDLDVAVAGLAESGTVPGRFEVVTAPSDPISVIVDYAHTPEGLEHVLRSARSLVGAGGVVVVFGCGGDRDVDKRPAMGSVAARHADRVVITSDNPRHEDPQSIVDAIMEGVEARYRDRVSTEVDRRRAIDHAVVTARPGDVVVVAGKGHETTQTIGDATIPFDDREVVREVLAGLRAEPRIEGDET